MASSAIEARAAELAKRPYTLLVTPNDAGGFTVQALEFPGAITEGDTLDGARDRALEAIEDIIVVMLEDDMPIPEPVEERSYSGTLQLRIPPSLHQAAAIHARLEGVSLNRWLSAAVAAYAGQRSVMPQPVEAPPQTILAGE